MTPLRPFLFVFAAAALMAQGSLDSAAISDTWDYWLDPIVVTATRSERSIFTVPYAVHLIGRDNIQRGEVGLSLGEALSGVPGIVVSNRHNLSQGDRISIRGMGSRAPFGVRGIKIYLDGIPLTMPDGQAQLNNLDLGSTGRIEALLGASSSLYGNAAGGAIHMYTQAAPDGPLQFQPRVVAGSYGLRKWQGKFSGRIGRQAYLVNVNRLAMDGYRDHSSARSTAVNAVGRRAISDHFRLVTVFNFYDAPYLLNPSSLNRAAADTLPASARFFVRQQGAGKRVRQGQGGITIDYTGDHGRQLKVTLHGLSRSLLSVIPGRIIDLERLSGGLRTVFRQDLKVGRWPLRWVAGTDVELQRDGRLEFTNQGLPDDQIGQVADDELFDRLQYGPRELDQDELIYGVGPFTQLEVALGPRWLVTVGERYDRYTFRAIDHFLDDGLDDSGTRVMERFSPMAGIVYRPHEMMKVYGNVSTAFQTPTTTELSNRPGGAGGFNPALKPEHIRSYEAGIKGVWLPGRLSFALAIHHL
ncbi:MAG: TonB-dependent receptor, partial [Candidatus Marinimicrobia bacterium]|nr:TonB-dependent receptor [Candidatus Neomarinimicrobiota bacterium]